MTDEFLHHTPPLLRVCNLAIARDQESIFGPINFDLPAGHALVIEGSNGAGKTTLLRVLAGLLPIQTGSIEAVGSESGRFSDSYYQRLCLLGHQLGLKLDLTPRENLQFRIGITGCRANVSIHQALASVNLSGYEDLPVRQLSAGQRKRVALAAVMLSPTLIWMLDEPYANLDKDGELLVDRMLETHLLRGGAVVLSSHGLRVPPLSKLMRLDLNAPPESTL